MESQTDNNDSLEDLICPVMECLERGEYQECYFHEYHNCDKYLEWKEKIIRKELN